MIAEHLGAPDHTRVLKVGKNQVNTTELLWCQNKVRAVEDALNCWPQAFREIIQEVDSLGFWVTEDQPDQSLLAAIRDQRIRRETAARELAESRRRQAEWERIELAARSRPKPRQRTPRT